MICISNVEYNSYDLKCVSKNPLFRLQKIIQFIINLLYNIRYVSSICIFNENV